MTEQDKVRHGLMGKLRLHAIQECMASLTLAERLALYSLVYALQPRCYVEIGTLTGGSAMLACAAMDARQSSGKIVCVDPNDGINAARWETLKHRTVRIKGRSPAALVEAYRVVWPFDFVFVDGDHSYKAVRADLYGLLPFLSSRAVVVLHDVLNPEVGRAVADACRQDPWKDGGLISSEPHEDGGATWGGLQLLRRL